MEQREALRCCSIPAEALIATEFGNGIRVNTQ